MILIILAPKRQQDNMCEKLKIIIFMKLFKQ